MKFIKTSIFISVMIVSLLKAPVANARLIPNPDGLTVYDTYLKVNWLANANLAGTLPDTCDPTNETCDGTLGLPVCDGKITVPCVDPNGAMSYDTAVEWVQRLNGIFGDGYLGHHDWTLPRTPASDPNCSVHDRNFGYDCSLSALGLLYYRSLPSSESSPVQFGFTAPDTTVPIPHTTVGPFKNFQPYLYWTSGSGNGRASGQSTFSFNTGWQGSNHRFHYMYVLPMIDHQVEGITFYPLGPNDLQVSSDGKMVYDPDAVADPTTGRKGVTWLADANLPATEKFGIHCTTHGRPCIDTDGSMTFPIALRWLDHMNNYHNQQGWLGQTHWQLAPPDPTGRCDFPTLHCDGGPLGELFFDQLGLSQGTPVVPTPNINVGPFYNLQPYLYWACAGPDPCQGPPPVQNQSWSFSLGNGFQGTDLLANNLYVVVYYPQTPAQALAEAIKKDFASYPGVRQRLLLEAAAISSATTYKEMLAALNLFNMDVNAQLSTPLAARQVNHLTDLAQAAAEATGLQLPPPPCSPHCI